MPVKKSMSQKKVVASKRNAGLYAKFTGLSMVTKVLSILLVVGVVGGLGTLGYTKYKERDLKAKAGANVVFTRGASGVTFSVCKIDAGNGRIRARGYVARGYSKYRNEASMTTYSSGAAGKPGRTYAKTTSNQWWGGVVTGMELPVASAGWVSVRYASSYTDTIFMGYVPWC